MSRRAITDQEWFFYIVRCRDDSLYSGIAVDLEGRLKKHNKGTGAKYTSIRKPVTLVYCEKYDMFPKLGNERNRLRDGLKLKRKD